MEEILKKLITFRTFPDDKEKNYEAIEWYRDKLPENFETEIKMFEGHPVLIGGGWNPEICLQAHMDVVPGRDELFTPKVKDGKLYGRGAIDMKFALACYLKVLKSVETENIGILVTSDEEKGGFNGTEAVLEEGYKPDFCFLPDGGNDWQLDEKAKGVWHLKVTAKGETGHASRPWEGDSALHKLIDFLKDLEGSFPDEIYEEERYGSTLNVGKLEGGTATNQIADKAEAKIDIRFTYYNDKDRIEKVLKGLENEYEGISVKEEVFGPSYICDMNNRYCRKFMKTAKEEGKTLSSKVSHGSSDARFFGERDIPTIMVRPKGGGSHSSREWVDLEDLKDYCRVLEKFLRKI